jgi:Inner membrane protein YgaP-like, transmembrane domain
LQFSVVGKGELSMTVERYLRLIAGGFVLATLLLGYFHSPYWFLFTGFVAINLIQSAFTDWCPMMSFLRWLGVKSAAGPVSRSLEA